MQHNQTVHEIGAGSLSGGIETASGRVALALVGGSGARVVWLDSNIERVEAIVPLPGVMEIRSLARMWNGNAALGVATSEGVATLQVSDASAAVLTQFVGRGMAGGAEGLFITTPANSVTGLDGDPGEIIRRGLRLGWVRPDETFVDGFPLLSGFCVEHAVAVSPHGGVVVVCDCSGPGVLDVVYVCVPGAPS